MSNDVKTVADLVVYWDSRFVDWEVHRWFYRASDYPAERIGQYVVWSNRLEMENYPGCFAVCDDFGSLIPIIPSVQVY